jgi:hypothetical protein
MNNQQYGQYVFDETRRRTLVELVEHETNLPEDLHNPLKLRALERAMFDELEGQFAGYVVRNPPFGMTLEEYLDLWRQIEELVVKKKESLKEGK